MSATVLPNESDGTLNLDKVELAIRNHHDIHQPKTELLCLENTQNRCGGVVLPLSYIQEAKQRMAPRGIKIHMDGARILNASVASGISVAKIVENVDSVAMCFSKVAFELGGYRMLFCSQIHSISTLNYL